MAGKPIKPTDLQNEFINLQSKLSETFDPKDVQQRKGTGGIYLDYIAIDKVYKRLNDLFPLGYDIIIKDTKFISDSIIVEISLEISLDNKVITRQGIGADKIERDVDKACKTAYAEAVKKACHSLGIALYLWDAEERLKLSRERANIKKDESTATTFTSKQIDGMKDIKTKFNINDNEGLNKFVVEWSDGKTKTTAGLKTNNIDSFITFMNEKHKDNTTEVD